MSQRIPPTPSGGPHKSYNSTPSATPTSSSSASSSSSSPYTPPDYSYFSPHAPFTSPSSAPNLSFNSNSSSYTSASVQGHTYTTHTTLPGGPAITSSVTAHGAGGNYSGGPFHIRGPHAKAPDVLQQFALHIPPPPHLSLSLSAVRNPAALGISSVSASSPNSHYSSSAPSSLTHQSPQSPQMTLSSTPVKHTLSVVLPRNIQPEMVTISANKGDRIRVVADAFGGDECHYEWQISFPPHDIDMSAVHARFDPDGRLTLDVKRKSRAMYY